ERIEPQRMRVDHDCGLRARLVRHRTQAPACPRCAPRRAGRAALERDRHDVAPTAMRSWSTATRAPRRSNDWSTASIIRTTSTPSAALERGVPPERIAPAKSASSTESGSTAPTAGDTIDPVRYVSLYSPKFAGSGRTTP